MGRCLALLQHLNLLLMVYVGAALAAAARLKWDPTLYVAARELFPLEYRALAAALPALAAALLLLAHLTLLAARRRRAPRRVLLALVGCGQLATASAWLALGGWAWGRAARWASGRAAAELRRGLALRDHALPLLQQLAYYHPLPDRIAALVQEAEADLPRNLHVLLCAAALLLALQLLAAALALRAARSRSDSVALGVTGGDPRDGAERCPLRAVYRGGRLVPVRRADDPADPARAPDT